MPDGVRAVDEADLAQLNDKLLLIRAAIGQCAPAPAARDDRD